MILRWHWRCQKRAEFKLVKCLKKCWKVHQIFEAKVSVCESLSHQSPNLFFLFRASILSQSVDLKWSKGWLYSWGEDQKSECTEALCFLTLGWIFHHSFFRRGHKLGSSVCRGGKQHQASYQRSSPESRMWSERCPGFIMGTDSSWLTRSSFSLKGFYVWLLVWFLSHHNVPLVFLPFSSLENKLTSVFTTLLSLPFPGKSFRYVWNQ